MVINSTVYTLGNVNLQEVIELAREGDCGFVYFVYRTGKTNLKLGLFNAAKNEKEETVVLGIASSKRLAQKLVVHIVAKALELDEEIMNGVNKLVET